MKKLVHLVIVSCFFTTWLMGQSDTISLLQCLESAQQNAIINAQYQVIEDIAELKIANSSATNLPSLSAYGKAWYQSDAITVMTQAGPGLEIDRFQYNAGLEADQKLFDGGVAKRSKQLEIANREAELSRIETEKYHLNTQVADLFFRAILFERSKDVVKLKDDLLQERVSEMESAYRNGIIKKNEVDKLKTELLLLGQQKIEMDKLHEQTLVSLSVLTGFEMAGNPELIIRDSIYLLQESGRPEHRYYDAESVKIENQAHLQKARNLPKFYAYGQAGYSYPGLNFFENESDYYYIVGARLAWTIFDWKQTGREAEIIRKQHEIVETKRENFDQELTISISKENIEQEKLKEIIDMDEDIIRRREIIARGSAAALANGTITSADYLEDLNAEIKARLDYETHKLQLQNSLVRQKLLKGVDFTK